MRHTGAINRTRTRQPSTSSEPHAHMHGPPHKRCLHRQRRLTSWSSATLTLPFPVALEPATRTRLDRAPSRVVQRFPYDQCLSRHEPTDPAIPCFPAEALHKARIRRAN